MDTKEQLREASEQLKESIKDTFSNLKDYGKAVATHTGETIKQGVNALKERFLSFKEGIKQKASTAKAKLGTIKTSALEKLNPNNLDVKFRDLVERVEIKGLEVAHKGKEAVIEAKDRVVDLYATQAANYYLRQEEKEQERLEQERIREEERAREAEIKANSREHKIGMKEALKEQDRKQREARRLQFRENIVQKTNSVKSKLGQIKTNLLEKLRSAKDKVTDFFAEKAAAHYLKQEERQIEKEFKLAQKEAEREEIEKAKARIRERKKDVAYALNAEEREMYEQRHLDNQAKKEELMRQLFGEKDEQEVVRTARAM